MVSSREGRRRAVEGSDGQHDEAGSQNEVGDQEPRVREAGAGERDENFNEEDPESQESDFETNLSRRASRNAKNRGGGDGDDEEYVEAKIPKDILKRVMPGLTSISSSRRNCRHRFYQSLISNLISN